MLAYQTLINIHGSWSSSPCNNIENVIFWFDSSKQIFYKNIVLEKSMLTFKIVFSILSIYLSIFSKYPLLFL